MSAAGQAGGRCVCSAELCRTLNIYNFSPKVQKWQFGDAPIRELHFRRTLGIRMWVLNLIYVITNQFQVTIPTHSHYEMCTCMILNFDPHDEEYEP